MIKIILLAAAILVGMTIANPKPVSLGTIISHAYTIELVTRPGHVGSYGMAKAIFKPAIGFKWNPDYPAKYEIQTTEFTVATPTKNKLNRTEFKPNGSDVILCVPYKGAKEGREKIQGVVSFSVCNKKECLAFRNQKLALTFIVKNKKGEK